MMDTKKVKSGKFKVERKTRYRLFYSSLTPESSPLVSDFSLRILILISVAGVFIQGCSTTGAPVPVEERSGSAAGEVPPEYQPAPNDSPEAPAVVALLDTAQQDMDKGRLESAVATMERALRLDPKNSLLWYRLALIRQQQKLWGQALSLAQKSNSLAAGNRGLQLANWKIIAEASRQSNDIHGADHAEKMIKQLTGDW